MFKVPPSHKAMFSVTLSEVSKDSELEMLSSFFSLISVVDSEAESKMISPCKRKPLRITIGIGIG